MILRTLTAPVRAVAFALWFAGQLVTSSGAVIADILTPGNRATPRVVRMPMGSAGDHHLVAISILITLTPGTLTLGVVPDGKDGRAILVHSLYHLDATAALTDLNEMDRRLVDALGRGARP